MSTPTELTLQGEPSGLALGVSVFAGVSMVLVGLFQVFAGLVAAINGSEFLVRNPDYVFAFNSTAWGWIHVAVGTLSILVGLTVFTGNVWARMGGIFIASMSTVTQFLWLPYYPLWAVIIIAIDSLVIWALCTSSLARRA